MGLFGTGQLVLRRRLCCFGCALDEKTGSYGSHGQELAPFFCYGSCYVEDFLGQPFNIQVDYIENYSDSGLEGKCSQQIVLYGSWFADIHKLGFLFFQRFNFQRLSSPIYIYIYHLFFFPLCILISTWMIYTSIWECETHLPSCMVLVPVNANLLVIYERYDSMIFTLFQLINRTPGHHKQVPMFWSKIPPGQELKFGFFAQMLRPARSVGFFDISCNTQLHCLCQTGRGLNLLTDWQIFFSSIFVS